MTSFPVTSPPPSPPPPPVLLLFRHPLTAIRRRRRRLDRPVDYASTSVDAVGQVSTTLPPPQNVVAADADRGPAVAYPGPAGADRGPAAAAVHHSDDDNVSLELTPTSFVEDGEAPSGGDRTNDDVSRLIWLRRRTSTSTAISPPRTPHRPISPTFQSTV